jgi:hypothetical protein
MCIVVMVGFIAFPLFNTAFFAHQRHATSMI